MQTDSEIEALLAKIQTLEAENELLRSKVSFFEKNRMLAAGISGETIVARILGGEIQNYGSSFDVRSGDKKIEVKYAKLNKPYKDRDDKRWAWNKISGEAGKKEYDYIVLIGEVDERYRNMYKDADSPYVIFLLNKNRVANFVVGTGDSSRHTGIFLTTNPDKAKGRAKLMFSEAQIGQDELKRIFNIR